MAIKARDDVTLATITDVSYTRRYYLLQSSTLNTPAAPTVNPAPAPWVTTEPSYTEGSTNTLYTVDLTVFTDSSFDYSQVSKSSSYEAAKAAYNKAVAASGTAANAITLANVVDAAAKGLVKASKTDPGQQQGRIWFVLNDSGNVIGMKISNGTAWTSYAMIVEDLMVVSPDGSIRLKDNTVTADTIVASSALWAKLATFGSVTTDMLLAGNATITGGMIVDELVGKTLRGGLVDGGEIIMREQGASGTLFSDNFNSAPGSVPTGWSNWSMFGTTYSSRLFESQTGGRSGTRALGLGWSSPPEAQQGGPSGATFRRTFTKVTAPESSVTTLRYWAYSTAAVYVDGVLVPPGVWTKVERNVTAGSSFTSIYVKCVSYTSGSGTVILDDVEIVSVPLGKSSIRLYRDSSGAPCLDLMDVSGVRRASFSTTTDSAGLTLYGDDQTVLLDQSGISGLGGLAPFGTANWADVIRSAQRGTSPTPSAYAYKNEAWSGGSYGNGWNTVSIDTGTSVVRLLGGFTMSGGGVYVPQSGIYNISASSRFSFNAGNRYGVGYALNGTRIEESLSYWPANIGTAKSVPSPTWQASLAAGDRLALQIYNGNSESIPVTGFTFNVYYVGPAE